MKRSAIILLLAILAIGLSGCGDKSNTNVPVAEKNTSSQVVPEVPATTSSPDTTISPKTEEPYAPIEGLKQVSFEEMFTLTKDETVQLKGTPITLKLRQVIYSPCFLITKCNWSGMAVHVLVTDVAKEEKKSVEMVALDGTYNGNGYALKLLRSDMVANAQFKFRVPKIPSQNAPAPNV